MESILHHTVSENPTVWRPQNVEGTFYYGNFHAQILCLLKEDEKFPQGQAQVFQEMKMNANFFVLRKR
jgi:hypothetical protein